MPKRPNAKKIASRQYQNSKTLEAAASGKYLLARVEKSLGFCQFSALLDTPSGLRPVTVLVRGKFKGGRSSDCYVEAGCYVLAEGDPAKTMEVVGVVNRQKALEQMRRAGRVSRRLADGEAVEDDMFEAEEAPLAAGADLWAKRDEEREALASELVARYQRRKENLGKRTAEAAAERARAEAALAAAAKLEAADEEPAEETDEAAAEQPRAKKGITSARRLRALQLAAEQAAAAEREAREAEEAEAAAWRARLAALEAEEAAAAAEEAAAAKAAAEWKSRVPLKSWEDEVDIDAI